MKSSFFGLITFNQYSCNKLTGAFSYVRSAHMCKYCGHKITPDFRLAPAAFTRASWASGCFVFSKWLCL